LEHHFILASKCNNKYKLTEYHHFNCESVNLKEKNIHNCFTAAIYDGKFDIVRKDIDNSHTFNDVNLFAVCDAVLIRFIQKWSVSMIYKYNEYHLNINDVCQIIKKVTNDILKTKKIDLKFQDICNALYWNVCICDASPDKVWLKNEFDEAMDLSKFSVTLSNAYK